MVKELEYLIVKRDLNFTGLKQEYKNDLLCQYNAILKRPKGICKEQTNSIDKGTKKRKSEINEDDLCDNLLKYCKNTSKKDRQFIFHGVLLNLSIKHYYMLSTLFFFEEIDEQDFNEIDFREGKCETPHKKKERNLEKSLFDLKMAIREKCKTEQTVFNRFINKDFDLKFFNKEFAKLAYLEDIGGGKVLKSKYNQGKPPAYLIPVCKKK